MKYNEQEQKALQILNNYVEEQIALQLLNNYVEGTSDTDIIQNNLKHDFITKNIGIDNKEYFWYFNENKNVAINIKTLEIIDDEKEINTLFNI